MREPGRALPHPDGHGDHELGDVFVEFARHLDILADQLGASLTEADHEFLSVGEAFHELAAVRRTIEAIPCAEPQHTVLLDVSTRMGVALREAVTGLQYHDLLAQRVGLVRVGLERLQTLLHQHPARNLDDWLAALREAERVNRAERLRLGPEPDHLPDGSPTRTEAQGSVELF
jgi:hypothetical protein